MTQHTDRTGASSTQYPENPEVAAPDEARQATVVFRTPRQRWLFLAFLVAAGIAAGFIVATYV